MPRVPANSRRPGCGRGLAQLRGAGAEALLARYAAPEEVMELPSRCAACGAPCTTRMFQCDIPFFKARSARLALPRSLAEFKRFALGSCVSCQCALLAPALR